LIIREISLNHNDQRYNLYKIYKPKLQFYIRVNCEGKTHSVIAFEAINIFMRRESKGFIGWTLESMGATIDVDYDPEPVICSDCEKVEGIMKCKPNSCK